MFEVNLEKELISSKKASLTKEEQVVLAEAEKIISNSTQEDIEILKKMGLNHSVEKSQALESKINFIKSFDKTRIFSRDEIKDLCATYGLRFLGINYYKGEIDPSMPAKVKEFETLYKEQIVGKTSYDENSYRFNNEFSYNKFMICAPKESFKLSDRPRDPLLFYPINNGKDYFLVHKWGSDLSIMNAINAWKRKGFWNWSAYAFAKYYLPSTALVTFVTGMPLGIMGVFGVATALTLIVGGIASAADDGSFFDGYFAKDTWNSEYRD